MQSLGAIQPTAAALARGGPDYRLNQKAVWLCATRYNNVATQMVQVRFAPRGGDDRCARCRASLGPFETCVASEVYFKGACAGCYWSRDGTACSRRCKFL
jgi:hypothetical protein